MTRDVDARERKALGDVARNIGAHQVQRDAQRPRPLQRRHAMADLFEAGAETPPQPLDVVAVVAAGPVKGLVGHDQRGSEVCSEHVPPQHRRVALRQFLDQVVDLRLGGHLPELVRDEEGCRFRRHDVGNQQPVLRPVIGAGDAVRQRGQPHLDAEDVEQIAAQALVEDVGGMVDVGPDALRRSFDGREVVGVLLQEIGDAVGRDVELLAILIRR